MGLLLLSALAKHQISFWLHRLRLARTYLPSKVDHLQCMGFTGIHAAEYLACIYYRSSHCYLASPGSRGTESVNAPLPAV